MTGRQKVLYRVVRAIIEGLSRLLFALTMEGTDHIPADGPFVLAPVHRSNVDFALMGCVTKRRIRFMAKDSLWKSKALGAFVHALGAYPVSRGTADRPAGSSTPSASTCTRNCNNCSTRLTPRLGSGGTDMASTLTRMDESTAEQWSVILYETAKNQDRVADEVLSILRRLEGIVD